MILTKEEAVKNHRQLWHTVGELSRSLHRPVTSHEALNYLGYSYQDQPRNCCWACEYAQNHCRRCPLDFGPIYTSCRDYSDYQRLSEIRTSTLISNVISDNLLDQYVELAHRIAKIPEKLGD